MFRTIKRGITTIAVVGAIAYYGDKCNAARYIDLARDYHSRIVAREELPDSGLEYRLRQQEN